MSSQADALLDQLEAARPAPVTPVQVSPLPWPAGSQASPYYNQVQGAQPDVDALLAQAANERPGMSTPEDVGRSATTGLQKGLLDNILGMPGQASHSILEHLHGIGVPVGDIEKSVSGSGLIGRLAVALAEGAPDPHGVSTMRQGLTGPDHQPQTILGRYAETAGEFAPAAALPVEGGMLAQVLARGGRVALPAAGSETAGQLTATPDHPEGNPWARMAGAIAGGAPTEIGLTIKNAPQALLAKGLEGVTPDHIAAATDLQNRALSMGIRLTPVEALDQVTGGASGANTIQHFVENSRVGKGIVAPMMADRPGQVSGAVGDLADLLAPKSEQPGMIGVAAQKAAQGGLDEVRQGINAQAGPAYKALEGQSIPPADYEGLASGAAYKAALGRVRGNDILNEPIAHLPDNNLAVVNEVKKEMGRSATESAQTAMNPGGNNQVAGAYSGASASADALARALSPEWAAAHDTVSAGRQAYLNPLEAGPAGKIAGTTDLPAQTSALYPPRPPEGAANETAQALRLMGTQDPQVGADLTRQHIMTTFNNASKGLMGGDNQWGGAKFAAQVAGNPEQAATLRAGIGAVNPDAAYSYDSLVEALRATGKRLPVGSRTAFNQEARDAFGMAPLPIRSMASLLDPLEIGKHLDNAVGGAMYRRNISTLAELLANSTPEEADAYLRGALNKRSPMPVAIPAEAATGGQGR